jgi:hypothetical protein
MSYNLYLIYTVVRYNVKKNPILLQRFWESPGSAAFFCKSREQKRQLFLYND